VVLKKEPDPEVVVEYDKFITPRLTSFLKEVEIKPLTIDEYLEAHEGWEPSKKDRYRRAIKAQTI